MICAERINFRNTWLYCSTWVCPSAELLVLYLQSHILSTSLNKSQFFYSFDNEILKCVPTNPYLSVLIRSQMAHTHQHHQKSQFHSWFHYTTLEGTSETTPRMADIHWYSPPIPSQIYPWVWYPQIPQSCWHRPDPVPSCMLCLGNYHSREPGCITSMLYNYKLDLPTLQDRYKQQHLSFCCKMVEGLIPAMPV